MVEDKEKPIPIAQIHCPHLGLDADPTIMLSEPTTEHRCYAVRRPGAPDLGHQQHFCLSSEHVRCPLHIELARHSNPAEQTAIVPLRREVVWSRDAHLWRASDPPRPPKRRMSAPLFVGGALAVLLLISLVAGVSAFLAYQVASNAAPAEPIADTNAAGSAVLAEQSATATEEPEPTATDTLAPTPTAEVVILPTVTPVADTTTMALAPKAGNVSWWSSNSMPRGYTNDSFLYAGSLQDDTYISAIRFDISRVPRGAEIFKAQLKLTGLREDRLVADPNTIWWVEVMAEEALEKLAGADFMTVFSAPSSITLAPIRTDELAKDQVNVLEFEALDRAWLEQRLLNGDKWIIVRIKATTQGVETRFGWDSGQGPETTGHPPELLLTLGPPPPTPPPIPTKPVIVATATPVPENPMTVVALNETATYVATAVGTYTPIPFQMVTPTPFPANLETVQAVAFALELPAVVPDTPTPGNDATATFVSAIATAVAQTTGTYTPVPTGYVTPILIYPSPPAESILTVVARETAAAAAALRETPTPVPFNAVFGEYVVATPTPENVLTAAVVVAQATADAEANGTPRPTPWNWIVITPTPLPVEPTATPTAIIEALSLTPTITPTPQPLASLDQIMPGLRNHILFKTTRNGVEEIFALDLATNQLSRINDPRVYPMAREQLTRSPDGRATVIVEADDTGVRQIKISFADSGERRRITTFPPKVRGADQISYDPAWSPTGNLIAFVTNNTGNDEIFTIDPEGQVLTQLTFNRTEWDKHPSWSPDGSQIVFFSNRDTGLRRLWIMNADGSGQREISSLGQPGPANPDYEDWDPVWVR